MGIHMMGGGGGEWFCLVFTSLFCFCIDRQFMKAAILCAIATFSQATMGIISMFNVPTTSGKLGSEKAGAYSADKDMNFGWMWSVALAMSTVFFLIHVLLQKANLVEPPIEDEVAPAVPAVAPAAAPVTVVDATEMPKEESEA